MPLFVATMPFGLRDLVEKELTTKKIKIKKKEDRALYFEGNWASCYEMNYSSRFASKILYSILDFPAYNEEDLYNNAKKHDYTKYIDKNQTIKVEAKCYHSPVFNDQRFVAMKVKDAIVDQFYEKYKERPDVSIEEPDLCLQVRVVKNQVNISIDTSGKALHERGYRKKVGEAPLKENLAAAIVELSGWQPKDYLLDPLCGSGTILIEAARKACQIPAGSLRNFAFQKWLTFKEEAWQKVKAKEDQKISFDQNLKIQGYDISGQNIKKAKENARAAGVDDFILFAIQDIEKLEVSEAEGFLISNPPYAERIGSKEEVEGIYQALGKVVHGKKNWDLWILAGDSELTKALRMKAKRKIPLKNGNIECRLLHYPIY